jgi:hypothetical protein
MKGPEVPIERAHDDLHHAANEAMLCQIKCSDQWSFYLAKSIKSYLFSTKVEILTV